MDDSSASAMCQVLEQRQENVLQKLRKLQDSVTELKQRYNVLLQDKLEMPSLFHAGKLHLDAKLDLVINIDPSSMPLSVVILCGLLQNQFSLSLKTFVHSNVTGPLDINPYNVLNLTKNRQEDVDITVNWIWKKIGHLGPQLIVDVTKQTPIIGEVNVARYLMRLLEPTYDTKDIVKATQIDELLDLADSKLLAGNSKDKSEAIEYLDSILKHQTWLGGTDCCVTDIVLWSALRQVDETIRIPSHVTKWLEHCKTHTWFQTVLQYVSGFCTHFLHICLIFGLIFRSLKTSSKRQHYSNNIKYSVKIYNHNIYISIINKIKTCRK